MKRKQLLKITALLFTLLLNFNSNAQEIDSYTVLGLNTPPTVNVISQFPHNGFEFTHFEMVIENSDIVTIDLFFKECAGDVGTHYIDTTYTPISAWTTPPDTIIIRLFVDSNTVDLNCEINPIPTIEDVDTIIVSELNIPEQSFDDFQIYPNPATTKIHLSTIFDIEVKKITLYNYSGRVVKFFSSISTNLDIEEIISGYYILEIDTDNKVIRKKIIIK